jgi:hypothetical protein
MINYTDKKLWGVSGGELEYVSQRISREFIGGKWRQTMAIRFTDHDVQSAPSEQLIEGKYYELEFPIAEE